jgi:hypothetical protein
MPEEAEDLQKDPYFFFVMLAGRETQRQVDNKGKNDQADDANGRSLCVDGDRRVRSGGERDDGDDDGCLSDWLCFYFEGKFHEWSQRRRGRWQKGLEGKSV